MCQITEKMIETIEGKLNKFQNLEAKLESAGRCFLYAMQETNKKLQNEDVKSIAYSRVYRILNTRTILLRSVIVDVSNLYNRQILSDMLQETVGAQKLEKMTDKLKQILNLLNESDSLKNSMREVVEDFNDCEEVEELIDAVESLSVYSFSISVRNVEEKLEVIKSKLYREDFL